MELETEEGRSHPSCCVLARLCFVCLGFGLCGTWISEAPLSEGREALGGLRAPRVHVQLGSGALEVVPKP